MAASKSLRARILAATPTQLHELHVPEWDATVYIRELTLAERDEFERRQVVTDDDGNQIVQTTGLKANLLLMCLVDETGQLIFNEPGDLDALGTLATPGVERAFAAAQRVNRMTKEDAEQLRDPTSLGSGLNGASATD